MFAPVVVSFKQKAILSYETPDFFIFGPPQKILSHLVTFIKKDDIHLFRHSTKCEMKWSKKKYTPKNNTKLQE